MKQRKILAIILSALMLLSFFAVTGCDKKDDGQPTTLPSASTSEGTAPEESKTEPAPSDSEGTEKPDAAIKVTDMAGHEITLDKPAEKVVALTPSDCEILYAIGAGDKLVGRGEYCDYPAEVQNVPSVQSGKNTNIEEILALAPQVLIMSTMSQTEEQVAQLEKAGVRVVVSDAHDIEGVYEAIRLIGVVMGKNDEAEKLVTDMKASFADLAEKAGSSEEKKSVYFEVSPLQYGLWTAGEGTFMDEVTNLLGLKNCFSDVKAWGEISEEQVLERNPDYIVTITMYFGEGPRPEEEIMARKGWENVTAVKNKTILLLPNNELSRPGPRLVDGARLLFEFVYGK